MGVRKLSEKYLAESGVVYLTGIQALVRLPVDQMRRDRKSGLKTGAFISGYEGSPLGGYDLALMREKRLLDEYNIHFRSGLNEEIAATSVFGATILDALPKEKRVDGVVGIWYGKGPECRSLRGYFSTREYGGDIDEFGSARARRRRSFLQVLDESAPERLQVPGERRDFRISSHRRHRIFWTTASTRSRFRGFLERGRV